MVTLNRSSKKTGRNESCPCGSGKKYKHCCMKMDQSKQYVANPSSAKSIMNMTNIIINYLESDRSYNKGVSLYQQFGKNKYLMRKLNLQGESRKNRELLHYQLFRLTGLPEKLFYSMMNKPLPLVDEVEPSTEQPEPEASEPSQPDPEITPVDAAKTRIRDEFPFLSDKNCPDAFKILVADMITAYENYVSAHPDLFNITHEKEAFEKADFLIDNYIENKAIWGELNYYKKNKKVLGKHPYFAQDLRRAELTKKSVPELIKLKENFEMNIWRNKKKLAEDNKPHLTKSRQAKISQYESDLQIVKSLLNINE